MRKSASARAQACAASNPVGPQPNIAIIALLRGICVGGTSATERGLVCCRCPSRLSRSHQYTGYTCTAEHYLAPESCPGAGLGLCRNLASSLPKSQWRQSHPCFVHTIKHPQGHFGSSVILAPNKFGLGLGPSGLYPCVRSADAVLAPLTNQKGGLRREPDLAVSLTSCSSEISSSSSSSS